MYFCGTDFAWGHDAHDDLTLALECSSHSFVRHLRQYLPDGQQADEEYCIDELASLPMSLTFTSTSGLDVVNDARDFWQAYGVGGFEFRNEMSEQLIWDCVVRVNPGNERWYATAAVGKEHFTRLLASLWQYGSLHGKKYFWGRLLGTPHGDVDRGLPSLSSEQLQSILDGEIPTLLFSRPALNFVSGQDVSESHISQTLSRQT